MVIVMNVRVGRYTVVVDGVEIAGDVVSFKVLDVIDHHDDPSMSFESEQENIYEVRNNLHHYVREAKESL